MPQILGSSLSSKLIRIGATLLVIAMASIGLTLWVTWQLEGGAAAVNEAGRMRMQTWRMASEMQSGGANRTAMVLEMDANLAVLELGDPSRPLFVPWDSEVRSQFSVVKKLWLSQRSTWTSQHATSTEVVVPTASNLVDAIDGLVTAIERQLAKLTAVLNLFQFVMMALAIFAAVVMLYTGYLYVINPLGQLQQGLRLIEDGDFKTRIDVDGNDEFARVATGFNGMAAKLQDMVDGLEGQVLTKTQHIEAQRLRIETLYDFSAFLAKANSLEEMSRGFVQRVRAIMKADAVTVRWADEANQRYLMLASDCFPQDLLEQERSVLAGTCVCGNLKSDAVTRVIPIVSDSGALEARCAKAGYESLVTVPIRLQSRMLGELNIFFRKKIALSADEMELLDALASHLASAMEGVRASALERENAVGEERALLARELHDSIAQSLAFLKIQVQLLRTAIQKNSTEQVRGGLDELDAGLKESISDVRELLVHFRTRTNTDDVETALQETLQKFKHQTGISVEFCVEGEAIPLPSDVQVQVLHVVQEALSNVRKHAKATTVQLLVEKGEHWTFTVQDDGAGFVSTAAKGSHHVGRHIMQERAQSIGAHIVVESSVGIGTTVRLTLPQHAVMSTGSIGSKIT